MSIPKLMLSLRRAEPVSLHSKDKSEAALVSKTAKTLDIPLVDHKSKEVAEELLKQLGGRESENEAAQQLFEEAKRLSPRGQQRLMTDLQTAIGGRSQLAKEVKRHWDKLLKRIDQNAQCTWDSKRWKSIKDLEASVEHPLHSALDLKDYTLLAELIGAGANVEDQNSQGQTLLQRVVTQLSAMDVADKERPSLKRLCDQLLYAGAIPEQSLHHAIEMRDADLLRQLVEQGADLELLDGEEDKGFTALQRVMLELSDLDEQDPNYKELHELYTILINAGADPNAVSFTHAHTLIHRACEELPWNPARIYRLIEMGVDPSLWNSRVQNAFSAMLAQEPKEMAEAGPLLIMKGIINRFATAETIQRPDNFEMTPLHHLAANPKLRKGAKQLVEALDNKGADIYAVDRAGRTPLYIAVEAELPNPVLIEALLSKGADPAQKTEGTHTPLDEVKQRLSRCEDPNLRELLEWTLKRFTELLGNSK